MIVGIDLGTSNSAVTRATTRKNRVELIDVPITQRVSEREVGERPLLPSFLYLPGAHELPVGAASLPWAEDRSYLVGEFSRFQGSRVPGRVVASAKSWLAHRRADPTDALLPWEAARDVEKVSPVEAVTRFLQHLREAWDHRFPDQPLSSQEIILAVPASFDELARELTVSAARKTGLLRVRLLEEPQAAFYCYLWTRGEAWRGDLEEGARVLVCDIGGGTTDFSLIRVVDGGLERVAVGEHLMLGGDNLDLALAHRVEPRLGGTLDILQWGVLRHECRRVKELLLGEEPPEQATVTVPGSGTRLLSGALTDQVTRPEVEQLVLDGFFPRVGIDDPVQGQRRGLRDWGLPFASDPAVPRHLASFLRKHGGQVPDRVLFNGGACRPVAIRRRLLEVLSDWKGSEVSELLNPESERSVARGAAYYGHLRQQGQERIRGGLARSYYLAVEHQQSHARAVCVVPRNLEEGCRVDLDGPVVQLRVDRPVRFPLYSSSHRPEDRPGEVIELSDDFLELPAMETVVRAQKDQGEVPVLLSAEVTEIGTLAIWCRQRENGERWNLEFPLRDQQHHGTGLDLPLERVEAARAQIMQTFAWKPADLKGARVRPRTLLGSLEGVLGQARDHWSPPVLRALWEAYYEVRRRRRVEAEYEAPWFNGAGFCLRPGTGFPMDDWRVERMGSLFSSWMQFPRDDKVRIQWWIMWRRLAGGLSTRHQGEIWEQLSPHLIPGRRHLRTRLPGDRSSVEQRELERLAAVLERISLEERAQLGQMWMERFRGHREEFWRLGRLAARQPLGGPQFALEPGLVGPWVDRMLDWKWQDEHLAAVALSQICRVTGDRKRDLDPDLRSRVLGRLGAVEQRLVATIAGDTELDSEDQALYLGDSLPLGLRL